MIFIHRSFLKLSEVVIRHPVQEDFRRLLSIAEQSPFQPTNTVGLKSIVSHINDRRVLLATVDGRIAGDILFRPHLWDEMPLYCEHVDVLTEFRGKGIGRILMAGMEKLAIKEGHDVIYSSTGEDNSASIAYHQALGFEIDSIYSVRYPKSNEQIPELMFSKLVDPAIVVPPSTKFLF